MLTIKEAPEKLKPYVFYGLDLSWSPGDKDAYSVCPFCEREKKMGIKAESGQFRCNVCDESGNIYGFLRMLHEASAYQSTQKSSYEYLAHERKFMSYESLISWGIRLSVISNDWLIPGYGVDGKLNMLYKYAFNSERGGNVLYAAPKLNHQLFGVHHFDKSKPEIWLCEGIWDCIAVWEVLSKAKESNGKIIATGNPSISLASKINVLGIAGNLAFTENMLPIFAGKKVTLMAQNDHAKINSKTKKEIAPASYAGCQRVMRMFNAADAQPGLVQLLQWGEHGYTKELKSGFDCRDAITTKGYTHV